MNYFYLAAGAISIFLSAAHLIWGNSTIIKELKKTKCSPLCSTGFLISWNQVAMVLFLNGLAFVAAGIFTSTVEIMYIPYFALIITLLNFITFLATALLKDKSVFALTMPQNIIFIIMITLIILGILNK